MRLKTRLTIAFLVMAWLPLGIGVWTLTERAEEVFESRYEARRAGVEAAVRAQLARSGRRVDEALSRMALDPVLDEVLLQALARGAFYGDQERERAIVREAERLITSPAVDTLRIVDLGAEAGRVIAMGHRRGIEAPDARAVSMAAEHPGEPMLRRERVENPDTGAADSVWTIQVVRPVDARVALVGGKILDRALLTDLLLGSAGGAAVALVDATPQSARVAATFTGAAPPAVTGGYDMVERPLVNPGSAEPVAALQVYVARTALEAVVSRLWETAVALAGVSALIALMAGLWISRRISRPLEHLAAAASAVAAGARDQQVEELSGRDEVAALTRAFNRMTVDLAESEQQLRHAERVAAWREIARRIAHEIKNPLSPIQMSIETLKRVWDRRHPDFEEIFEESTVTILEEVGRMKRIVTEFSDFARMPAPSREVTDLAALGRQVVGLHRDVAEHVNVSFDGPASVEAVVDPDQVRQVLINLVKNAGRGGGRGGRSPPARPRRRGRADRERQRGGAARGRLRPAVHPILHHQDRGDRPRPGHRPSDRLGARRRDQRRVVTRGRDPVHDRLARRRRFSRSGLARRPGLTFALGSLTLPTG